MLVMLGDDLGTTFLLLVIFLALLWVIGTPGRMFIGILAMMGFVMIILIIVAPYRLERITGFLHPQAAPVGRGQPAESRARARSAPAAVRRRARRRPGEVGLGAELHHRLHLRHHRRGTRAWSARSA